jgi:dipeptidyl-peptidase 4
MLHKIFLLVIATQLSVFAQQSINLNQLNWLPNSHKFWVNERGNLCIYDTEKLAEKQVFLTKEKLEKAGFAGPVENLVWNQTADKVLIYTNSQRVWRENTRGDYWLFDLKTGVGRPLGKGLPAASLMFAKFAPDSKNIAYVSQHNIYTENLATGKITKITTDGSPRIINGTFDWAYEEELLCRDGFSWSPNSRQIAFWRVDARNTRYHLMINNTDSLYPYTVPVEYPKAGERPSAVTIGTVDIVTKKTTWQKIPGQPDNNYIPRMQWLSATELAIVQLNRLQNEVNIYKTNANTGAATKIYTETSDKWIDVLDPSSWEYDRSPLTMLSDAKSFLWSSDTDGWQHIYKIDIATGAKQLITTEPHDAYLKAFDPKSNTAYYIASPTDATQRYLYAVDIPSKQSQRLTPSVYEGTNTYVFSPDAQYARHNNSNINRNSNTRLIKLAVHSKIFPHTADVFSKPNRNYSLSKIKVTTADGISLDGLLAKPLQFDSTKKYPVYFHVYGEPASSVANDAPQFDHFIEPLIPKGYIAIALDNRGTPVLKGKEWRKSIYTKLGSLNSRDQALAAKEILKWPFIDPSRVAVHGWSGGGAMTLNLLFRYPEIYTTGIAVAAITDQHFYDNIYTERYMGLPQQNTAQYTEASPITYAHQLKGNLLYMHGTGDDNVHYKNAEVLINELVKHNKMFQIMPYPNRTHGIYEGPGTSQHLMATFHKFLETHCPPGGR